MATEKRLIYAGALWSDIMMLPHNGDIISSEEVEQAIKEAPTVDAVEVVHGRWEKCEPDKHGNKKPKCSVCGQYHLAWWSDYTHCNYCPNCGAKMDGDSDGTA